MGVIDVKDASNGTLFVFAIKCDVMIGIAFVFELVHYTSYVHCWLLTGWPHTTQAQLG